MTTLDNLPRPLEVLTIGIAAGLVMVAGCESSSRSITGPSASKCEISIPISPPPLGATGGSGSLTVTAARECTWSATSTANWITIAESSGQGEGVINYAVAVNPAPSQRHGTLIVGDQRLDIVQEAASCAFAIAPVTHAVGTEGGEPLVTVDTGEGCSWTTSADATWIDVLGSSNITGPGTIRFRVQPNAGGERTSTVSVAGQTVVVHQAGAGAGCTSAINPIDTSVPATGGTGTVTVTSPGGCGWTAASQSAWITVTSGAVGNGMGTVALSVAPNAAAARVGTVVIAGRTFTVTQAGVAPACSFSLSPSSYSVGAAGGAVTTAVVTAPGCAWTAASQAAWIAVTGGASGSGNGTVSVSIDANAGAQRTGTVVIGDRTFSVTQAGVAPACSYSLSPSSHSVGAAGGAVTTAVVTPAGCAWTTASQAAWIAVTGGASGNGNGTVSVSIDANAGAQRTGTVVIGDRTFSVTQAGVAPACSYTVSPTTQTVPLVPLTHFTVSVDTQAGCTWTATSANLWITITSGSSGTGGGTVTYLVGLSLFTRTGTITISGQTLTVHQGGLLLSHEP